MRNLEQELQDALHQVAIKESPSCSFEDVWLKHTSTEKTAAKRSRPRRRVAAVGSSVAGLGVAAVLIYTILVPHLHNQVVSTGDTNGTQNQGLRQDILAQRGFDITGQQNVVAQFILQPSWIPTELGAKNDIHHVFYNRHNTQLSVEYVRRTNDGNVEVVIQMASSYSTTGGSFATSTVVEKNPDGSTALTSINWGQTVTAGQAGKVSAKDIPPLFTNAQTGHSFTVQEVSASVGDNQLMFEISEQDIKKYFTSPTIVTIPDLNLITYKPPASIMHNRSLYQPKLGWIDIPTQFNHEYYVVTNEPCTPAEPLGTTRDYGGGLGGASPTANVLPSGTQLYRISGVDPKQAICVALDDGNGGYVKAVYAGQQALQ